MSEGSLAVHPTALGREFRKPICPKGHDKRLTGIGPRHFCLKCRNAAIRKRERARRRAAGVLPPNCAYLPSMRYWRIEADITQRDLAARAGLSRETVIALETGRKPAKLTTRQRIAAVLGIQPGLLVMRPPGKPKKLRAGYGPAKPEEKRIA